MIQTNGFMGKNEFVCLNCNYKTHTVFLFKQHFNTKKHKKNSSTDISHIKDVVIYCPCGKYYKHKSSYYRHLKGCDYKTTNNVVDEDLGGEIVSETTTIKQILKNILNENIKLREDIKHLKITNNININLFLNDKCKNAMNLTDFIDNMKMSIEDLEYSGRHGYVKGVSQILMKNLTNIEPHERPLHCSDMKRLKFYVKDNDIWERDINNIKLDNSITYISKKQHSILKKWESLNPNYENSQEKLQQYFNMVGSLINGRGIYEIQNNNSKIIRNVSTKINIKKIINTNE